MFERFTPDARAVVVQAREHARRLGHPYIGCEHLLLAASSATDPAGVVLRDHGVTPDRIESAIVRLVGHGQAAGLLSDLDRGALAAIGIDLDAVRERIEAAFGPDALAAAASAARDSRRPTWQKGPVAELLRRRRRRTQRTGRSAACPPPTGHIPFAPQAKKSLERSLREARALHDNHIGVKHVTLALVGMNDGAAPPIVRALGASRDMLRTAILDSHRRAS